MYQPKHLAIPLLEPDGRNTKQYFSLTMQLTALLLLPVLRVSSTNLSPGGNQNRGMRDRILVPTNRGRCTPTSGQKVAKGVKAVLQERGSRKQGKL